MNGSWYYIPDSIKNVCNNNSNKYSRKKIKSAQQPSILSQRSVHMLKLYVLHIIEFNYICSTWTRQTTDVFSFRRFFGVRV